MAWFYLDEPAPGLWCADMTYRDTCWNGAAAIVTIYTCHFPTLTSQNVCCEKGPSNSAVELLKISALVSLFSLSAFACWLEHLAQSACVWVQIHRAASMALDSDAWVSPIPESLIFLFLHPSKPPAVSCLVYSYSLIQNMPDVFCPKHKKSLSNSPKLHLSFNLWFILSIHLCLSGSPFPCINLNNSL